MNTIKNTLSQILRPLFCVVRNIEQQELLFDAPFDISRLSGEFVGLTSTYESALQIIPQPRYPEDVKKQELFHQRFGWKEISLSDGTMIKQVPHFRFDDNPKSVLNLQAHQLVTDSELFGESYTIFWFCPSVTKVIDETIIDHLQQILDGIIDISPFMVRRQELGFLRNPYETITSYSENYILQYYFDRMCVWSKTESGTIDNEIHRSTREIFESSYESIMKNK